MSLNIEYKPLTILLCLSFFLALMASQATVHPLSVTKDGEEEKIEHKHVCTFWDVTVEDTESPTDDIVRARHHRKQSEMQIRWYKYFWDLWGKTHANGKLMRTSPPTNEINCHGLTFDDGKSWIDDPTPFLESDACEKIVDPDKPKKGDVVVYKYKGKITHTGRLIDPPPGETGQWVYSQFGSAGDFKHPINAVPKDGQETEVEFPPGSPKKKIPSTSYGDPVEFYRCK